MDKVKLGKALREQRERRKMSQRELAKQVGCTYQYISSVELGKENPTVDLIDKIAKAIHCELLVEIEVEEDRQPMPAVQAVMAAEPLDQELTIFLLNTLRTGPPQLSAWLRDVVRQNIELFKRLCNM